MSTLRSFLGSRRVVLLRLDFFYVHHKINECADDALEAVHGARYLDVTCITLIGIHSAHVGCNCGVILPPD